MTRNNKPATSAGVRFAIGIVASRGDRALMRLAVEAVAEEVDYDSHDLTVAYGAAFIQLSDIIESARQAIDKAYGEGTLDRSIHNAVAVWRAKEEGGL